jgi:hypothetical protein
VAEEQARDERHEVGEAAIHDCEVEDGVYGDGVDEHEEAFEEGAEGYKRDGSGGRFVHLKNPGEGATWKTMICFPLIPASSIGEMRIGVTYHVQTQTFLVTQRPSISNICKLSRNTRTLIG